MNNSSHITIFSYQIEYKTFFNESSASDLGTTCASMHRTGKINAKRGPEKDFNAYREFHDRELQSHILASFMVFAGMKKQTGKKFLLTDVSHF